MHTSVAVVTIPLYHFLCTVIGPVNIIITDKYSSLKLKKKCNKTLPIYNLIAYDECVVAPRTRIEKTADV